jgi:riboflavin kinase/FMN adenylyltransferase
LDVSTQTAISVGNFDGVHLGHRALIERARERVGRSGRVVVLSFDPHPMTTLNPELAPAPIEPFSVRARRLRELGADEVVRLEPTPELLGLSPEAFVDSLIERYAPDLFVEGHDFHFGKRRAGTPDVLKKLGSARGVGVDIVEPVRVVLTNQFIETASSSLVRWLLGEGRVRDAAYVLGRDHELSGTVVRGQRLGRTIGLPTINLRTPCLLPKDGVYGGYARVGGVGGSWAIAAINIGTRPSVDGVERRAEAHLLGPDGSALTMPGSLDEYGWETTLRVTTWIRDQVRFESIDALAAQIRRDCARIVDRLGATLAGA